MSIQIASRFFFDGWIMDKTRYVAVFGTFPAPTELGFKKVLLGFSPMGSEDFQGADAHHRFVGNVLEVQGETLENVVAIIGDNTPTNKAFVRILGPIFIGCHRHRFNLAMKDYLSDYQECIESVNALMRKICNQISAAKLRALTHLTARTNNETRWSSTFLMLTRFFEIKDYLCQLSLPEIDALFPEDAKVKELETLMKLLMDLKSVTKALQDDSVTLVRERALFDEVIHFYPSLECCLGARAPIVENKCFEEAVLKIQAKRKCDLTLAERPSIRGVALVDTPEVQLAPKHKGETLMAEKVSKKRRNQETVTPTKYLDLCFLLATSNICERIFSKASYALSDRRRGISPANFECQLYLHVNCDYCCIADVRDILE